MALKQDERALIQLVCERGQSYADLADLLGINEDEVRAKARGALTELGGSDPDAEVGLTDYLLGQADPIGRADVVRYLQQDDATRELAASISTKLAALAPGAELPTIPEPRGRKRKAAAPSPAEAAAERDFSTRAESSAPVPSGASPAGPGRSPQQTRLFAGIAAGAVILIFVVLAIAGVFGSDDSSSDAGAGTGGAVTDGTTAASDPQRDITTVKLDPVDGSGVAGEVSFGLENETTLFADVNLTGLKPRSGGKSVYLMWLILADSAGYPIPAPITPDANGSFQDRVPIDAPVAAVVAGSAQSVRISDSDTKELSDAVQKAANSSDPQIVVPFIGTNLAEGEIPLVEGAGGGGQPGGNGGDQPGG